jgi:hypothetical protein
MSQIRLLARIRREFQDHPGIALTLPQARRLWSLDERRSAQAFDALLAEGYLWAAAPAPRFRLQRAVREVPQPLLRR